MDFSKLLENPAVQSLLSGAMNKAKKPKENKVVEIIDDDINDLLTIDSTVGVDSKSEKVIKKDDNSDEDDVSNMPDMASMMQQMLGGSGLMDMFGQMGSMVDNEEDIDNDTNTFLSELKELNLEEDVICQNFTNEEIVENMAKYNAMMMYVRTLSEEQVSDMIKCEDNVKSPIQESVVHMLTYKNKVLKHLGDNYESALHLLVPEYHALIDFTAGCCDPVCLLFESTPHFEKIEDVYSRVFKRGVDRTSYLDRIQVALNLCNMHKYKFTVKNLKKLGY